MAVATMKVLAEYVKHHYEARRAEFEQSEARGNRLTARDPRDNVKLAAVTLTDPDPVVRVNEPVWTAWMREHYPSLCETVTEIAPGMEHAVVAVLFEHAPHLLTERTRVKSEHAAELKASCKTIRTVIGPMGETEMPGFTVEIPDPVVSCRLSEGAHDRVLEMVRTGQIELDGTLRPAIDAAVEVAE